MAGTISLLVSRDLANLVRAAQAMPREVASQMRRWTRADAEPIWKDEVTPRGETKTQAAVLVRTARVSVSDSNVLMKSGTIGKTHGIPNSVLASGAEFGAKPDKKIKQRSSRGKTYTRRLGPVFRMPRRKGYVVFESAAEATPRIASLWLQTAIRTVAEMFEKAGA